MRVHASPSERNNNSVKDFKSRFETMNSLSTYDAAVNKARLPKSPSSRSNTPITSRSLPLSDRPDVSPEAPISRHMRTMAATAARKKANEEKAKTPKSKNKADSLTSGRVNSPTFDIRYSSPTRLNDSSKDTIKTKPKTNLESPRSATVNDINSTRKSPEKTNDYLFDTSEKSPTKGTKRIQKSEPIKAQKSGSSKKSPSASEPKRKISRKRSTKASPKVEIDSDDEHYPKSNKYESYTDQNEIEELNNAIEELLCENEKLKTDIDDKILDMKSQAKQINEPDPQTSFYFNQQALLHKQAEENRKERIKNEKIKKRLDRKRRDFQKLIFAASYSNMNMNMNNMNMNYAQREKSEPKQANSYLKKENKVLLAEIDGLQRELSATLHTLEKTEKERNESRSQVIKCTSCIQLLAEEIEHLRERNTSLEKKLEDNEFEQEELLAEWSYKMKKNEKKCSDQEELIQDLQLQLSSVKSLDSSEAKDKKVVIDQEKRADAEEKYDNILSELEDNLTIVNEEIDKTTMEEKKYEMEGNEAEVKAVQERRRLLNEMKSETEQNLKDMQNVRTKYENAMDNQQEKNHDELTSEKRDTYSPDESPKILANISDLDPKRENISSRLGEVDARVDDYRKHQRSISVTPVSQSISKQSSNSSILSKNSTLPIKVSPTNQSGSMSSSKNLRSSDSSIKTDTKVKEASEVHSKKIELRKVSPPMTFRPTNNGQNKLNKENANNISMSKTPNSPLKDRAAFPPKPLSNSFRLKKTLSNAGSPKRISDSVGNVSPTMYRKEAKVATKSLRQPNGNFKIPGSDDDQGVNEADLMKGFNSNYQKPR